MHESLIVIDRLKAYHRPRFPEMVYTVGYSYLKNTTSKDGGIDVWRGTAHSGKIDAILCADLQKKDSEIKIVIGCYAAEKKPILQFNNRNELMKVLLVEVK